MKVEIETSDVADKGTKMSAQASEMNSILATAYIKIAEMSNIWKGQNYNDLATSFNKMKPDIDNLVKLTVIDIPTRLQVTLTNYTNFFKTDAQKVYLAATTPINLIDMTTGDTPKIDTDAVKLVRDNVNKYFGDVNEHMQTIQSIFNSIHWTSNSAREAFRSQLAGIVKLVTGEFESIISQFTGYINAIEAGGIAAEKANTYNAE